MPVFKTQREYLDYHDRVQYTGKWGILKMFCDPETPSEAYRGQGARSLTKEQAIEKVTELNDARGARAKKKYWYNIFEIEVNDPRLKNNRSQKPRHENSRTTDQ